MRRCWFVCPGVPNGAAVTVRGSHGRRWPGSGLRPGNAPIGQAVAAVSRPGLFAPRPVRVTAARAAQAGEILPRPPTMPWFHCVTQPKPLGGGESLQTPRSQKNPLVATYIIKLENLLSPCTTSSDFNSQ